MRDAERRREYQREYYRRKYANDQEYRNVKLKYQREYYKRFVEYHGITPYAFYMRKIRERIKEEENEQGL